MNNCSADVTIANECVCVTDFDAFELVDDGILIGIKKKEVAVNYSELGKVYIRKCKFGFWSKLGVVCFLFVLVPFTAAFLPIEYAFFAIAMACIPLLVKLNSYKSYQLVIQLRSGVFYRKNFVRKVKYEITTKVSLIRKEIYKFEVASKNTVSNSAV